MVLPCGFYDMRVCCQSPIFAVKLARQQTAGDFGISGLVLADSLWLQAYRLTVLALSSAPGRSMRTPCRYHPSVCPVSFVAVAMLFLFASATAVRGQVPSKEDLEKALNTVLPEDPATVVAVVGQSKILYGDVKAKVDARVRKVLEMAKQRNQPVPEESIKFARVNLTKGFLRQVVETKMMREAFLLAQVGTQSAEKRQEAAAMMSSKARQMFIDSEVPGLLKRFKVNDMTALDEKLREEGTSLHERQRDFTDAMLGHMYVRESVEKDPEVSLAEIKQYYDANQDQFRHKAQARWEQLTVYFENFPSRAAAHAAISEMGREAYFGSPTMQPVAKAKSQEPLAKSGGVHDWTNQGSLASDVLDKQIFSLPLNKMSEIIEDDRGYHIVKVLDRKPAGVKPLSELQDEIREAIRQRKVLVAQRKMMDKMLKMVPVWSLFPDDIPGAKPLPKVAAAKGAARVQ